MNRVIKNGKIILSDRVVENLFLIIEDGIVKDISDSHDETKDYEIIDAVVSAGLPQFMS